MEDKYVLLDMALTREICSAIKKERIDRGFKSLKYPLYGVTINKYLLPHFRELIADDCNLIGYMDIPAVEVDVSQKELIILDTTTSSYQQEIYENRVKEREEAEERKSLGLKQSNNKNT